MIKNNNNKLEIIQGEVHGTPINNYIVFRGNKRLIGTFTRYNEFLYRVFGSEKFWTTPAGAANEIATRKVNS